MNCPNCGARVDYPELPVNYCDRCGKPLEFFELRAPKRSWTSRLLTNNVMVVVLVVLGWALIFKLLGVF